MKKMILSLAVAACTVLASCGGGGPEADAKKMCEFMEKAKKLKADGAEANNEEVTKLMEEMDAFSKEVEEKYKDDKSAQETIGKKMMECMSEH